MLCLQGENLKIAFFVRDAFKCLISLHVFSTALWDAFRSLIGLYVLETTLSDAFTNIVGP